MGGCEPMGGPCSSCLTPQANKHSAHACQRHTLPSSSAHGKWVERPCLPAPLPNAATHPAPGLPCSSLAAKHLQRGDRLAAGRPDAAGCVQAAEVEEVVPHWVPGHQLRTLRRRFRDNERSTSQVPLCGFDLHATEAVKMRVQPKGASHPEREVGGWGRKPVLSAVAAVCGLGAESAMPACFFLVPMPLLPGPAQSVLPCPAAHRPPTAPALPGPVQVELAAAESEHLNERNACGKSIELRAVLSSGGRFPDAPANRAVRQMLLCYDSITQVGQPGRHGRGQGGAWVEASFSLGRGGFAPPCPTHFPAAGPIAADVSQVMSLQC